MHKMFTFNDTTGQCGDIIQHANGFMPYAHKKLGFNKPVGVNFISDPENAKNAFGKTGYYDPNKMEITIFVDKRHVKDILRSLSHELVHHTQNCRGEFDQGIETGDGYAQKDPHMRKMEAEAYLLGNGFLFRDYEDQLKENKAMANKKKINIKILSEQSQLKTPDWGKLELDPEKMKKAEPGTVSPLSHEKMKQARSMPRASLRKPGEMQLDPTGQLKKHAVHVRDSLVKAQDSMKQEFRTKRQLLNYRLSFNDAAAVKRRLKQLSDEFQRDIHQSAPGMRRALEIILDIEKGLPDEFKKTRTWQWIGGARVSLQSAIKTLQNAESKTHTSTGAPMEEGKTKMKNTLIESLLDEEILNKLTNKLFKTLKEHENPFRKGESVGKPKPGGPPVPGTLTTKIQGPDVRKAKIIPAKDWSKTKKKKKDENLDESPDLRRAGKTCDEAHKGKTHEDYQQMKGISLTEEENCPGGCGKHEECAKTKDGKYECQPAGGSCVDCPDVKEDMQESKEPCNDKTNPCPPGQICMDNGDCEEEVSEKNENWFRGNKDSLLFERLTKKWTK